MAMTPPARRPVQLGLSAKEAAKPTGPAPITRTRTVKRYVATCPTMTLADNGDPLTCDFTQRAKPQLHGTADAATVESVRHLRTAHAEWLSREVQATRTVQVQRTVVGDELIAD